MPRIQLSKVDAESYKMYLKNCFSQDEEIKTLYIASLTDNSIRGTVRTKFFKQWFLCALEKFNSFPSNNRMNKQKLYSVLFTYGFPMGFIAKVLLDGNLGPIRNSILLYKSDIKNILENRSIVREGFLSDVILDAIRVMPNTTITPLEFYKMLLDTCYVVGGLGLARKLTNSEDITSFIANYPEAFDGSVDNQPMFGYNIYPRSARRYMAELESDVSGERGQRRTGVTTSREVVGRRGSVSRETTPPNDIITIERQTPVVIPTPPPRVTNQTSVSSSDASVVGSEVMGLVKDSRFKNTLGIEIEYYGASFRDMKEQFAKFKVPLWPNFLRYHEQCSYDKWKEWRIMADGSLRDRFGGSGSQGIDVGEIVAPILVGERGLVQLAKVLAICQRLGCTMNNSTGLHVHFGVKGPYNNFADAYDIATVKRFIANFMGFEKIIDAYCRPSRRQSYNGYTPSPILDFWPEKRESGNKIKPLTQRELEDWYSNVKNMADRDFINYATQKLSRGKINVGSNNLAFSIEIRQHGGTWEKDTVIGWVMFLHYLFELSKRRVATKFTWKNLKDNVLPRQVGAFWENRIFDMTGHRPDDFDLDKNLRPLNDAVE
jgi:hypothetical protein